MDEASSTLSRARGRVRSGDGTRIAYERHGEGPWVIVVSGALGTAAEERALAGLLAPRFSVVTYDRRGRGGSGDTGPYAVEREIDDLAALVTLAGEAGDGVCVHGTASGGALALTAAAAGLPIGRLSVYEPPYATDPEAGEAHAVLGRRLAGLLGRGRRGDALDLFLADAMAPGALTALRGSPAWPGLEALAPTLAYDHAILGDGQVPYERLTAVHARVLVVDGGFSPAGTRRAAGLVSTALPRGRHRTLTGQTHLVAPHVLAPVLEDFFTEE
ncbi:alpha/beta fold hydrolase [Streptomyces sp. NPDC008121]|uniref:alpha/beta fold hydrolase n=1 Tax=Streptomyces sp. NPDC008121 TaxID=3364809 RepID=UPI0036E3CAEA